MKYSKAILIAVSGATLAVASGGTADTETVQPALHLRKGLALAARAEPAYADGGELCERHIFPFCDRESIH